MRQYVKMYFQSTGDTEWAEKNYFCTLQFLAVLFSTHSVSPVD